MPDNFASFTPGLSDPVSRAFSITPGDTELAIFTRALYVGGAGTVVCRLAGDSSDVTFSGVPAGSILPVRVKFVRSSSSATNMLGLY